MKGSLEESVLYYQKVLEFNPEHTLAYFGLGVAYAQQNKRIEATEAAQKALELSPANQAISKFLSDIES